MIVPIDIETIPQQPEAETKAAIAETIQAPAQMKKADTIAAWHAGEGSYAGQKEALIEEKYLQTALDGGAGEVVSICWMPGLENDPMGYVGGEMAERRLLLEFWNAFNASTDSLRKVPYFVGHNVAWDLRFLWQRSIILNAAPGFRIPINGRHGKDFFDNMQEWAGYRNFIKQDLLCSYLGIDIEGDPGLDGSQVYELYKAGKYSEIFGYNRVDVLKAARIYKRLNI